MKEEKKTASAIKVESKKVTNMEGTFLKGDGGTSYKIGIEKGYQYGRNLFEMAIGYT